MAMTSVYDAGVPIAMFFISTFDSTARMCTSACRDLDCNPGELLGDDFDCHGQTCGEPLG
jgi:hypothetical protein